MNNRLNFDFDTTQAVIRKIGAIDGFNSRWEATVQKESVYLKDLRRIALLKNTWAATKMTGGNLNEAEVEWVIKSAKKNRLESREEQIAAGYYETLNIVLNQYKTLQTTEQNILTLHDQLLQFDEQERLQKGQYKTEANPLYAIYPDGTKRELFKTADPKQVNNDLKTAIAWLKQVLEQKTIHPLLAIGAFQYEFLCIHPFQSGNGRLSRLLTILLSLQNGYTFMYSAAFEQAIENKRLDYFKALRNSQKHRGTEKEIIGEWMLFFLETLESLTMQLDEKYRKWQTPGNYLSERQKKGKEYIGKHQPVKAGDLQKALPEILLSNLRKDLQYLVNAKEIEKIGTLKSTIYIAAEK